MFKINNSNNLATLLGLLISVFTACSTNEIDSDNDNNIDDVNISEISNTQHISFFTPQWSRVIDCSLLDFQPVYQNDSTSYISASSASTKQSFYFTYPSDSATLVKAANLKKYPIRLYANHEGYFEFSQKLPYTEGSAQRLISEYGYSDSIYNQIVSVKYIESKASVAKFEIKGRYVMMAYLLNASDYNNTSDKRKITGAYNFKISVSGK